MSTACSNGEQLPVESGLPTWLQVAGKPRIIQALLIINTVVFATMAGLSGFRSLFIPSSHVLLSFGASSGAATIVDGEFWRILTSSFLHIGFLHLMMNCYVLWDIGPLVERLYGWRKFLAIYILSALGASLVSLLFNPLVVSAGASGAIFGILGALGAFLLMHRAKFPIESLKVHTKILGLILACGFICGTAAHGVDNAAHVGGLLVGALSGFALIPPLPGDTTFRKSDALMTVLCASVLLCFLKLDCHVVGSNKVIVGDAAYRQAVTLLPKHRSAEALPLLDQAVTLMPNVACVHRDRARALSDTGKQTAALQDCNCAINLEPKNNAGYIIRSGIYHNMGDDRQAVSDLSTAIALNPKMAVAYNNRAWSYLTLGDYKSASRDIDTAISLDNKVAIFYDTRAVQSCLTGRYSKALQDLNRALLLAPREAAAWYHRACIYRKLGKYDAATGDLSKALALGYKPEPWESRLADSEGCAVP